MEIPTIHNQIAANKRKSFLIMFLFSVILAIMAYVFSVALGYRGIGGLGFVGIALIVSGIMNLISYWYSDKIVLAASQAILIDPKSNRELYHLVENLSIARGLPVPKIYIIPDTAINAFATGRDPQHAAIAFTQGIVEKLTKQELEGVAAHELSHVGNYDTRLMAIVSILVGTVALLADMFWRAQWFGGSRDDSDNRGSGAIFMVIALIMAILAPIAAQLIQLAVSRRREYLADASGALITRNPDGLADALAKISRDKEPLEVANSGTAHLYIANPLKGQQGLKWFTNLFMTHPPIEDRIKALRQMERTGQ